METQQGSKGISAEDLTLEQRERNERALAFFRRLMRSKHETQAEIRNQADNPEFWRAVEPLLKRNRERGTPLV